MLSLDRFMKKTKVPVPRIPGKVRPDPEPQLPSKGEKESAHRKQVKTYEEEERELYRAASLAPPPNEKKVGEVDDIRSHCALSEIDSMTVGSTIAHTNNDEETSAVYRKYSFVIQTKQKKLEVYQKRDEILQALEIHNVVIIKGATGCGKSTQVPQFILEDAKERNVHCKIVVTQPRRLAAVTVANRVAEERGCSVGSLVGYQIGQHRETNDDTRILYVTTGVLLQKLINQKEMKEFTHYIIDEIHERDQNMDFLLYMVRKFVNINSRGAKLILMSATVDTAKFHEYLYTYVNGGEVKPTIVEIGDKKPFHVKTFYIDKEMSDKIPEVNLKNTEEFKIAEPKIQPNVYKAAARIIERFSYLEREENDDQPSKKLKKGAVLVFLPGLHEIQTMEKTLKEVSSEEELKTFWIKPLHSSITADEQKEVFKSPPSSMRKIILSTNIAESSITVTDIKYVIDFCLTKALVTDPDTGCTFLELVWASKNNLIQRAGRVGRVQEGRVYRMISKPFYDNDLEEDAVAEILRCPLEGLVLNAKLLEMDTPEKVLALTMGKPNLDNIQQSVARLKQIGALLVNAGSKYSDRDGDLTLLGRVVASLPIDVRLGKLIFLGAILGVAEECIVMACAMSTKNMFSNPYMKELEAYVQKLFWADSSCSDSLAFLNAYKAYRRYAGPGADVRNRNVNQWTKDNFLQFLVLKEVSLLEDDIKRRLKYHELYSFERRQPFMHEEEEKYRPFFLKIAIAGAFYPNYFIRADGLQLDEKEIYRQVGGHDPFSTVYLQGLPSHDSNAIYKNTVKELFAEITDRLDVNMDNSSKTYVTFRRPLRDDENVKIIPGKIHMSVYKALKLYQIGKKFHVPRLKPKEIERIVEKYEREKGPVSDDSENEILQKQLRALKWPWLKSESILPNEMLRVLVSHVESPERFWVQNSLSQSIKLLLDMSRKFNDDGSTALVEPTSYDLPLDSVYVARNKKNFERCRIVAKGAKMHTYALHFIDSGCSLLDVPADQIYDMSPEVKRQYCYDKLPPLAVECALAKIQPRSKKLTKDENTWDPKAISYMQAMYGRPTIAKVYSIVNDIVRVKLVKPPPKGVDCEYKFEDTINYRLLQEDLAETAEEDFLSLSGREELKRLKNLRQCILIEEKAKKEKLELEIKEDGDVLKPGKSEAPKKTRSYDDIVLPTDPDKASEINLRGPFSPLEMKISTMVNCTDLRGNNMEGKPVAIERDSVNSVLLDSDPTDPKDQMLVAAYVGIAPSKASLRLKHTTIMPKFPALPMLCCLTFAPMVEMKVNPSRTKYCGALCGLGYDLKTGKSFYPTDDIAVVFDYKIDNKVLNLINHIRLNLSRVIEPTVVMKNDKNFFTEMGGKLRKQLRQLFLDNDYELMQKECLAERRRWGTSTIEELMIPSSELPVNHPTLDCGSSHRLIWAVKQTEDKKAREEEEKAIVDNLIMLEEFSSGKLTRGSVKCHLCDIHFESMANCELHVKTARHRLRQKPFLEKKKERLAEKKIEGDGDAVAQPSESQG